MSRGRPALSKSDSTERIALCVEKTLLDVLKSQVKDGSNVSELIREVLKLRFKQEIAKYREEVGNDSRSA